MNIIQKEFEEWFIRTKRPYNGDWRYMVNDEYINFLVQAQWELWQAAWKVCLVYNGPYGGAI